MAILWKKEKIQLPKVAYASILTVDECKEAQGYIPLPIMNPEEEFTFAWYLRTPGDDDGTVCLAEGNSFEDEITDVDWFDNGPEDWQVNYIPSWGTGTRPALYFESSLPDSGAPLGSKLIIGDYPFTVISDRIALCDTYISNEIFDENTNDYESAAIKKRVDEWFETDILPNC